MRNHNGGDWETFQPLTNVMVRFPFLSRFRSPLVHTLTYPSLQWLHYLVLKLLHSKRLRQPTSRNASVSVSTSTVYTERECYESLVEMEVLLATAVEAATKPKPKQKKGGGSGRKAVAGTVGASASVGPKSAEEVLNFGREKGWVRKR